MVLTEPDAGSDVGAGRTKATKQDDGSWHIEGVKRFITSAEHDLTNNIFHLVLARPEGAGAGTKGLSLFFVPKYFCDWETGELQGRNGVEVTNVEHKMGLRVSTTCELTFGDKEPAVGWLVGEVHDGIAQMFKVIEFARMMVGTKAIATLSTGYLNALDYAKTRVQGADLTQMTDKTAPRVTITHHPDVRRSLMTQKAYAEGMRALVLYTASIQDDIAVKEAAGTDAASDERLNDLLLPIVKGYGSEKSYALLGSESLQTFGGSGYLQDYPLEQYIRDAKIDTLYEGTTAIQGLDLFFRKIVRDQGQALTRLLTDVQQLVKSEEGSLRREQELLGVALEDVQGIVGTLVGLPDHRAVRRHEHLQGRPEHDAAAVRARGPRRGLAAAAPGRGCRGRAGRLAVGARSRVLHREDRGCVVLRPAGAAADHRAACHRGRDRQRADGPPGGRLLATSGPHGSAWRSGHRPWAA